MKKTILLLIPVLFVLLLCSTVFSADLDYTTGVPWNTANVTVIGIENLNDGCFVDNSTCVTLFSGTSSQQYSYYQINFTEVYSINKVMLWNYGDGSAGTYPAWVRIFVGNQSDNAMVFVNWTYYDGSGTTLDAQLNQSITPVLGDFIRIENNNTNGRFMHMCEFGAFGTSAVDTVPPTNSSWNYTNSNIVSGENSSVWNYGGLIPINITSNNASLTFSTNENANCSCALDKDFNHTTMIVNNSNYKLATTNTTSHALPALFDNISLGSHCIYCSCIDNAGNEHYASMSGCLSISYIETIPPFFYNESVNNSDIFINDVLNMSVIIVEENPGYYIFAWNNSGSFVNETTIPFCYQEHANVSTACGGLSTGEYSPGGSWTDGNWNTYTDITGGVKLLVDWSIPNTALNNSLYQTKMEVLSVAQTFNFTIPNDCWDYSLGNDKPIMINITQYTSAGQWSIVYYCYNGTDWDTRIKTVGSDPNEGRWDQVYEGAMWWNISGTPYTNNQNISFAGKVTTIGNVCYHVWADDSSGNINVSDNYCFNVSDKPPFYSNGNSTNTTGLAGEAVEHRLNWTDDIGLSGYIFSIKNGTTVWVNDSWVSMIGTLNWSNYTTIINSSNSTITWRFHVNDTTNNWNVSSDYSYTVTTAPVDSCSCPGLNQNWEVDHSDYCNLGNCELGTGTLNFTGSGETNCTGEINTTNMGEPGSENILWINDSNCIINVRS